MAEEKEKGKDAKGEAQGAEAKAKKKGLPAAVMALIGAVLGGAGVVVLSPKPEAKPHGPPPKEIMLYDHPDEMEFTVNPIVERGHKTASVVFTFTYKADVKDVTGGGEHAAAAGGEHGGGGGGGGEHGGGKAAAPGADALGPVPKAIQLNWKRAYSRCLEVLSNQKASTLLDPEGKKVVKRLLIEELSASLFPDGIATVDDILWKRLFVQ